MDVGYGRGVLIMKNQSRAIRIHHNIRLYKRALKILGANEHTNGKDLAYNTKRLYNNMQHCSCSMCCNERNNPWAKKYDRLTMQEKKAEGRYICDIIELQTPVD